MKSLVRLAPGKPEVVLYWTDQDGTGGPAPRLRQKRRSRRAWLWHEPEPLDDWEDDPALIHRKGYALPR